MRVATSITLLASCLKYSIATEPLPSIADLALSTPELSTLADLVIGADLAELLADCESGPFTVFAPTNEEFEKLKDTSDIDITNLLLYHVLPGKLFATDLEDHMKYETVQGDKVTVLLKKGGTIVKVKQAYRKSGAKVIIPNVEACNGVVHVVNSVLKLPEAMVHKL